MSLRSFIAAAKWPALTALGTFAFVLTMTGSFPYSVAYTWQRLDFLTEEMKGSSVYMAPSIQGKAKTQWTRTWDVGEIDWQSPPLPRGIDKDCGDFTSQHEAQRFFNAAGRGDPHRLDADNDGRACEWLR